MPGIFVKISICGFYINLPVAYLFKYAPRRFLSTVNPYLRGYSAIVKSILRVPNQSFRGGPKSRFLGTRKGDFWGAEKVIFGGPKK